MADNNQKLKCSGNCLNCLPAQRAYCASQHAYSNMKVLDAMMEIVISMRDGILSLSEKIEAIQSNEAHVFDPLHEDYANEEEVAVDAEEPIETKESAIRVAAHRKAPDNNQPFKN